MKPRLANYLRFVTHTPLISSCGASMCSVPASFLYSNEGRKEDKEEKRDAGITKYGGEGGDVLQLSSRGVKSASRGKKW